MCGVLTQSLKLGILKCTLFLEAVLKIFRVQIDMRGKDTIGSGLLSVGNYNTDNGGT